MKNMKLKVVPIASLITKEKSIDVFRDELQKDASVYAVALGQNTSNNDLDELMIELENLQFSINKTINDIPEIINAVSENINRIRTKDVKYLVGLFENYAARAAAEQSYFEAKQLELSTSLQTIESINIEINQLIIQKNAIRAKKEADNYLNQIESQIVTEKQVLGGNHYSFAVRDEISRLVYTQACSAAWFSGLDKGGKLTIVNDPITGFDSHFLGKPFREGLGYAARRLFEREFDIMASEHQYLWRSQDATNVARAKINASADADCTSLDESVNQANNKLKYEIQKTKILLKTSIFTESVIRYAYCFYMSALLGKLYSITWGSYFSENNPLNNTAKSFASDFEKSCSEGDIRNTLHLHHKFLSYYDSIQTYLNYSYINLAFSEFQSGQYKSTCKVGSSDCDVWVVGLEAISKELVSEEIFVAVPASTTYISIGHPRCIVDSGNISENQHDFFGINPNGDWKFRSSKGIKNNIFLKLKICTFNRNLYLGGSND